MLVPPNGLSTCPSAASSMRYRRPSFSHSTRSSCSTRSETSNTVLQYMSVQVSVGIGTKIGTDRHPVFPTVGRRPKLGSIVRFPPEFSGRSQLNVPHFRGFRSPLSALFSEYTDSLHNLFLSIFTCLWRGLQMVKNAGVVACCFPLRLSLSCRPPFLCRVFSP